MSLVFSGCEAGLSSTAENEKGEPAARQGRQAKGPSS